MRLFGRQNVIGLRNRFTGGPGISLYVSPAGVDDARRITYRRRRCLNQQNFMGLAAWTGGGDYFLHDSIVSQVTCPATEITYALPDAYTSTTFWVQLRTFEGGLENPQIYAPQRISVDGSQDESTNIDGTASITAVEKRDAAGLRVRFEYHAALTGIAPAEFVLAKTAGAGTVPDVSVPLSAAPGPYEVDVPGLTDAGAYTFTLTAKNDATEKLLATINFTADGDGGGAVQSLSAAAC